jgi:hypothetical protein
MKRLTTKKLAGIVLVALPLGAMLIAMAWMIVTTSGWLRFFEWAGCTAIALAMILTGTKAIEAGMQLDDFLNEVVESQRSHMTNYPEWRKRACPHCAAGMPMVDATRYHWSQNKTPNGPICTAPTTDDHIATLESRIAKLEAPLDDKFAERPIKRYKDCQCLYSDAWRCAKNLRLARVIACECRCHREAL